VFKRLSIIAAIIIAFAIPTTSYAGPNDFQAGPAIESFGKIASVDADFDIPRRTRLKVVFDTAKKADSGELNRTLNSAARFINMHADAGIPVTRIKLAVVFHGKGSFDLTRDNLYKGKSENMANANKELIAALQEHGVRIILCGQSAAYHEINKEDLLPGIEMALSAMTAHALLQQEGYTLNPF